MTPPGTYADYLALEARSDEKHEYLRGEVFAMAGGPPEHSALAASVTTQLSLALEGKPCRVYGSDLRVRIEATDLTTYPDISVVCGQLQVAALDPHAIVNPIVLVEILSDSTEGYDRGQKAAHYRRIPTLAEYLLVSQKEHRLELYRRSEARHWELHEAGPGEALELRSLGVRLEVDTVYRDPLARG